MNLGSKHDLANTTNPILGILNSCIMELGYVDANDDRSATLQLAYKNFWIRWKQFPL